MWLPKRSPLSGKAPIPLQLQGLWYWLLVLLRELPLTTESHFSQQCLQIFHTHFPLLPPHWLIQRYPSLLDSRWDNSALWYNYALKLFRPKCSSHMWLLRLWTWLVGTEMCGKYKIQRFQKLRKKECKMCHSCFKVVIIHYNDTIVYIWDSIKYIKTDFTCFFSHSMLLLGYLVWNFHSCMS